MRKWLVVPIATAIGLAASLTVASAADMAVKAPLLPPTPLTTWNGWYIGANAGYGWSDPTYIFSGDNAAGVGLVDPRFIEIGVPRRLNTSGFLGGGQIGYNWQLNRKWVAGLEADIDFADVDGNSTFPTGNSALFGNADRRLKWFGTLRPRIGFLPTDRFLVFATGGLAYGQTKASSDLSFVSKGIVVAVTPDTFIHCEGPGPCMAGSDLRTSLGWTAGGGVEYAITNFIRLKAEYLYIDLGSQVVHMATVPPQTGNGLLSTRFDNAFQIVRVGIDYRFGAR